MSYPRVASGRGETAQARAADGGRGPFERPRKRTLPPSFLGMCGDRTREKTTEDHRDARLMNIAPCTWCKVMPRMDGSEFDLCEQCEELKCPSVNDAQPCRQVLDRYAFECSACSVRYCVLCTAGLKGDECLQCLHIFSARGGTK